MQQTRSSRRIGAAGSACVRRRRRMIAAAPAAAATALMLYPLGAAGEDRFGESRDQDQAYRARHRGEVRSLDSVIGHARSKGKVLDVQLKDKRYKFKILFPDGRVRILEMDAGWGDHSGPGGGGGDHSGSGGGEDSGSSGSGSGGDSSGSGSGGSGSHEGSGGGGRGGRR